MYTQGGLKQETLSIGWLGIFTPVGLEYLIMVAGWLLDGCGMVAGWLLNGC